MYAILPIFSGEFNVRLINDALDVASSHEDVDDLEGEGQVREQQESGVRHQRQVAPDLEHRAGLSDQDETCRVYG